MCKTEKTCLLTTAASEHTELTLRSRSYHRLPSYLTTGTQVIESIKHFVCTLHLNQHIFGERHIFWGQWTQVIKALCVYIWQTTERQYTPLNEAACYCRGRPLVRCNCLRVEVFTFSIHLRYLRPVQPVCRC